MLFNSYIFLLLYLPVTLIVFFRLGAYSHRLAAAWLGGASLFFYGYWNPTYVGLLLASIFFNYGAGIALARERDAGRPARANALLAFTVGADLALLGYYKYANFFIDAVNQVTGSGLSVGDIMLPLGISFFTFTQIAFLVDAWSGKAREYSFIHYLLFVTYFPHLIAGPVLHHKEMMPQFGQPATYRLNWDNLAIGGTIFALGLFKKAVLADGVAPQANAAFTMVEAGQDPDFLTAWGGALAYTGQLYFDFSGYSDMAIGLSRMFGIILPLNFNSPYKAVNIIDFWRRWHMTLSRFLRDYLYIPLGGSRKGPVRRYLNLLVTMLLGGLWHGAAWTYVLWGGLHGLYLVVNHTWRHLRSRLSNTAPGRVERTGYWLITFLAVVVAWVFFRATSLDGALGMLKGMAGLNGFALPAAFESLAAPLLVNSLGLDISFTPGGGSRFLLTWGWSLALLTIALFLPNTQEIMAAWKPGLDMEGNAGPTRLPWRPSVAWAWGMALLMAAGLLSLSGASEFLYYQF